MARYCEKGNEISAFVKGDKFLDQPHDSRLCIKKKKKKTLLRGVICEYINVLNVVKLSVPVHRCLSLSKQVNQTAWLSHTVPNNLGKRNIYIASSLLSI